MSFDDWWKRHSKNISKHSIPGEIKYFAAKAWDAAIEKENQSFCACNPKPSTYWPELPPEVGNAIVPQVVTPIMEAIKTIEDGDKE